MKIAHIVGPDINGGAARGALWLHRGLIESNISSHLFVQYPSENLTNYINSESLTKNKSVNNFIHKLDRLLLRRYPSRNKHNLFSPGLYGSLLNKIDSLDDYDIIHLHWINNGLLNIKDLEKIKKPIVWTIRDMWPFTGGCHYSLSCEKYKGDIECGKCPQLGSLKEYDLSRKCFTMKKESFSTNITPVAISPWLQKELSESTIFNNSTIEMINNGIDTSSFKVIKKEDAREHLGLSQSRKFIGIGALNLKEDKRKGLMEFIKALNLIKNEEVEVILFGSNDWGEIKLNHKIHHFGKLDNEKLSLIYSALDVFVAPSLQEAFGKTIAEAMYCGTPVVTFDNSGAADIIKENVNGYTAEYLNIEDLSKKIEMAIELSKTCSSQCTEHIKSNYDLNIIAKKYVDLYKKILN